MYTKIVSWNLEHIITPSLLFLLIRSIKVSNLKFIRNMLLLITHKGCILPSSWFSWKCHSTASCYESMSTTSSDGAVVFSDSVDTISPPAMWGHNDYTDDMGKMWSIVCATFFTPCLFPSYNSLQILTVCPTHCLLHVNTLSLFPGNPHHIPSHSFLNK